MNIPNFQNSKVVDEKGMLTAEWANIFQQLFTELQINVSNEGYKVPQQTTTTISTLNNTNSTSALIYDSTLDELKVNLNGVFKTIQTI